ncbi:hypothetical protein JG688_00015585 [Phytophthora aleatoria]|uniref:Uncharacterized protein n=1 Tax=Phytophthora aleatoria TaxID=2496075 RepID=A0A8J5M2L6_9STRA|nr:hypothetical protein JG688_00015585 [Phytophthora aleatoria]
MHDKRLSMSTFQECIGGEPAYLSAAHAIAQFKLFVLGQQDEKCGHFPLEIVSILPADLLRKCSANVTAPQAKRTGIVEKDVAIEIVGLGVYMTSTLRVMKKRHQARKTVSAVNMAVEWIGTIDLR